jgi:hypothetical protein
MMMNKFSIVFGAMLIAALEYAPIAWSHDLSGSLGVDQSATDHYLLYCNDDGSGPPDHLFFQLTGGLPASAPLVSAQIQIPDNRFAVNLTDPKNGDKESSRGVDIPGGAIAYELTVNKSGAGKVSYSFTYHCQTASGAHTGTENVKL